MGSDRPLIREVNVLSIMSPSFKKKWVDKFADKTNYWVLYLIDKSFVKTPQITEQKIRVDTWT